MPYGLPSTSEALLPVDIKSTVHLPRESQLTPSSRHPGYVRHAPSPDFFLLPASIQFSPSSSNNNNMEPTFRVVLSPPIGQYTHTCTYLPASVTHSPTARNSNSHSHGTYRPCLPKGPTHPLPVPIKATDLLRNRHSDSSFCNHTHHTSSMCPPPAHLPPTSTQNISINLFL